MKFTTHLELHSQTTRLVEGALHGQGWRFQTGFSPSMMPSSRGLKPQPTPKASSANYNSDSRNWKPDFKFELLPLHSPLLRQSLLVSFPPLIDMLKFSGYSYLIRGQLNEKSYESWGRMQGGSHQSVRQSPIRSGTQISASPLHFKPLEEPECSTPQAVLEDK